MDQAFMCFHEQGIVSLFLQFPGNSSKKNDQLRFSLNLLARFRQAVENNASITFRYLGRAITIPLIHDIHGKPDPNLTLVAGLNGLSSVNMREIVKQAVSFCELAQTEDKEGCVSDNYNKIFSVRSLRTQLIQPPVEINTLLMIKADALSQEARSCAPVEEGNMARDALRVSSASPAVHGEQSLNACQLPITAEDIDLSTLTDLSTLIAGLNLNSDECQLLSSLLDFPQNGLDAETLARHLVLVNRLLHAIDPQSSQTPKIEQFLDFLGTRLEKLPTKVFNQMEVQRRGLKIDLLGRKVIVGLVHPQLIQLITLIHEKKVTLDKIECCHQWARDHFSLQNKSWTEFKTIFGPEAEPIATQLADCLDEHIGANLPRFIASLESQGGKANQIAFEILWGLYRHYTTDAEHHPFYPVLPLIAKQVKETSTAVNFLLADLFQPQVALIQSDHHAFALATLMLRTHHKERTIDIHHTPEEVLAVRKSLNRATIEHVAWRLNLDRQRVVSKFRIMRETLRVQMEEKDEERQTGRSSSHPLLGLEREGLIFLALVGGASALSVFREALAFYCDPNAEIYHLPSRHQYMHGIMSHLKIVLRGMARLGTPQDLETLKSLEQSAARLMALDTDPAYARRVKQTLQWIAPAIRSIQLQIR
ncbi:MAG: hypothetical protein M0036_19430 [Desulfobacteraceae bacterium]|nr:hypothetical protein [Desulfobacteraceae bacterium]